MLIKTAPGQIERTRRTEGMQNPKRCNVCRTTKPETEFKKKRKQCNECVNRNNSTGGSSGGTKKTHEGSRKLRDALHARKLARELVQGQRQASDQYRHGQPF